MKRFLLVPLTVALLLPLNASALSVTFNDWGGNVSANYTLTIDDGIVDDKIRFTATVDTGFTAAMLAIAFDTIDTMPPIDYNLGNLGLMMDTPLVPGTVAFDTLVCNPNQGCNFNGATSDPFDVIVRFAAQGSGVPQAIFDISDLGGDVTAADFTRVGIRAQDTGPESCLVPEPDTCDSDKAISPPPVPEPGTLLLLGSGLLLLRLRAGSPR